jgi:hypothetical protein
MVNAENAYGSIAPTRSPVKTKGYIKEISAAVNPTICKKPPYNDKETSAALPIANPFPIAAVVFPAASRASVLFLTSSPNYAISAIPPALSEIGP